jgi:hypothetical protein
VLVDLKPVIADSVPHSVFLEAVSRPQGSSQMLIQIKVFRLQATKLSTRIRADGGKHVHKSSHRKRICGGVNA